MAIYMTARFKVWPEARLRCEQAIREFVEHVKVNEPCTRLYTSVQETADAASFLHFFVFEDAAARDAHANSAAVKRFTEVLYPETLAPVEFIEYSRVASTGSD